MANILGTLKMIEEAAKIIKESSYLIITSGAGMGVDSGLPDFRGREGFWKAYPPYEKLGIGFEDAANPYFFKKDPHFAWGFYGHRTNLYRETVPNEAFNILRDLNKPYFVVTSNVDGQFQKASFDEDKIVEIHGSIHYLQCTKPCCNKLYKNDHKFVIDEEKMVSKTIPICPKCGLPLRPNILMFSDSSWISTKTDKQEKLFKQFLSKIDISKTVVIEIGAGTAIPSIRNISESLGKRGALVIRINPREYEIKKPHISINLSGVTSLKQIKELL